MTSKLLFAGAAIASLAACASVPEPAPGDRPLATAADRHQISVVQAGDRLDVAVAAADMSLTPQARAQLASFGSRYVRMGHGALVMSTPSGGANADAAARLAHEARMRLTEAGVPYSAIAGSSYDGSAAADAPIVLSFTRYEATAPTCAPLWEQDLAHQSNNQPYASFGCSGNANLAAMIEDPHDLLAPRNEESRDGARRATVMDAYRRGEPTGAARGQDERVSISNAVQ